MDPIVSAALVGTARQEQAQLATGTPVDALIAELPKSEAERAFLLSAGAWAVYRQAGQQPRQIPAAPEPARTETLRACSPQAALLISRLLGGEQPELLSEALTRMRQLGLYLPSAVLPQALNVSKKETRAALFPVLGERGLWLSQFNPSWSWVRDFLPAGEDGLPAEAETIWQEGTNAQRVEILSRLRAVDPTKARDWLADAWKKERAEVRTDLLATLETGLGAEDETFLEKALDDRALGVRIIAASLLSRLPNSAFGERMRERGGAMLKMVKGKLAVKPPAELGKDWLRDGITENPPGKVGKRAWRLIQVLALIPPTFWETHLEMTPAELLSLVAGDQWEVNLIDGWSRATIEYNASSWIEPLWSWWAAHFERVEQTTDYTFREQLLKCMPQQMAEQKALSLLNTGQVFLSELPGPWSVEFGRECLRLFRHYCPPQRLEAATFNPYADPWFAALPSIAQALSPACFAEAARPWDIPESTKWQIRYAAQKLQAFIEMIQMRQKIHEEIA